MKIENPKISAVIITKDDLNCINAIKSVYNSVIEIILVNTAKTSKVKKFLKDNSKVKYYYFKWVKDFSKARNYGIKKAKGDWIFTIDSDEVLAEDIKYVNDDYLAYMTKQESHGLIVSKGFWTARLFQNNRGIFYKGKVHESIDHALNTFTCVNSDIVIKHSGYNITEEDMQKKLKRNYEIMFTDKKNVMYNTHMGAYHVARKEYLKAIAFYNKAMTDRLNDPHFAVIQNNIHLCRFLMEEPLDILISTLRRSLMFEPFQFYARVNIIEHLLSVINEQNKDKYVFIIKTELDKIQSMFNDKLSCLLFNEVEVTQEYINQKWEELDKWGIKKIAI